MCCDAETDALGTTCEDGYLASEIWDVLPVSLGRQGDTIVSDSRLEHNNVIIDALWVVVVVEHS